MTARSAAIAAAYMMTLSQGGLMRGGQPHYVPPAPQARKPDTHDAEHIAKAVAKRARKAAKRAKQMEAKP